MVVVDTNVLAWLFVEGEPSANTRALYAHDADWHSERFVLIEMTNVLATTMRVRGMTLTRASDALLAASRLIEPGLVTVEHADALAFASRYRVSAYDARFLAAARALDTRLVTEDSRLRRAAPALTRSLVDAIAEI